MIKRNMVATIVIDKELEVNVRTSDKSDQVILELPVAKVPINMSELREAISMCERFIMERGDKLSITTGGENTTLNNAAYTMPAATDDEHVSHMDVEYGDDGHVPELPIGQVR